MGASNRDFTEQRAEQEQKEQFENFLHEENKPAIITFPEFSEKVNAMLDSIEDDELCPLEAFKTISQMQKLIKIARDTVEVKAIKTASNLHEDERKAMGITTKQGSYRLSYKGLSEWEYAKGIVKNVETKYKTLISELESIDNKVSELESFMSFEPENEAHKSQLSIMEEKKALLAKEYGVSDYFELYMLCPEVSITKSSISYTPPKKK